MRKIYVFLFSAIFLLTLTGCQSLWYLFLDVVVDIAPDRFVFEQDHQKLSIPLFTSHSLNKADPGIDALIVVVHGGGLNAGNAFENGKRLARSLKADFGRIMICAPQFLEGVDVEEKGLLFWGRRWRSGGKSLAAGPNVNLPQVDSFEAMDRLVDRVAEQNPNLRRILFMGHSAGGQYVLRYAALNNRHESWEKLGITVVYAPANPSTWLYLDDVRYRFNSTKEIEKTPLTDLEDCPGYNQYKYGLENLYGYGENLSSKIVKTRVFSRPLLFVLGREDTERNWSLDKSCEGDAQGENRYERGLLYRHHLKTFAQSPNPSRHVWLEIPEMGHEAKIFTHPIFVNQVKQMGF